MPDIRVNPFKALRERQGLSQYEISRRTGVSKHAILRLEQGMFSSPLPTVVEYFRAHYPTLNPVELEADYHDFQIKTRESNARLLGDLLLELPLTPVGMHPLAYLRESRGINPTELAKRLCVAQSDIVRFEKRSVHQQTVPQQLILALHDADYTEAETQALEEAYAQYRSQQTNQRNLRLVHSAESVSQ